MKFMKTLRIWVAAFSFVVTNLHAQQVSSGYFADGFLYRHEINPAIGNGQNYVSFPGLGNLSIGARGNVSLSDFIYSREGKTVLFLNPLVPSDEFLENIKNKNRINADVKVGIMSFGFKAKGSYNTFALNLRSNIGIILPGGLFRMAKEGPQNQVYDFSSTHAHADAFLEVALGHSRSIDERWRVGGKIKLLIGGANLDARLNNTRFELYDDRWLAMTDAEIQSSIRNMTYQTDMKIRGPESQEQLHEYVNGMDVDKFGLNGAGMAFDLGSTYRLNEEWNFGLSLLDLGFIRWKNNMLATTDGQKLVSTDDYIFSSDDDASNSFENEWDRFTEGLSSLYELEDKGDQGGRVRALGATLNVSAEYICPFYRPLSFGLINTTRVQGSYSWTEFRLSANVAPCNFFSASVNFAEGTFGPAFGWLLNIYPKGFNLFLGMDYTFVSLAKPGIPLSSKYNANLGINFPF